MKESDIQRVLTSYILQKGGMAFTNTHFLIGFEQDVLEITQSMYAYEYEIKLSMSDYYRDFSKRSCEAGGKKHLALSDMSLPKKSHPYPKGFYFVVPDYLARKITPKEHTGLISVAGNELVIVKKAPIIKHGKKLSDKDLVRLLRKISFRNYARKEKEFE